MADAAAIAVCETCGMPVRVIFGAGSEVEKVLAVCGHVSNRQPLPDATMRPVIEYVYARYNVLYLREADSVDEALSAIEGIQDSGEGYTIGVYENGEPIIANGFVSQDPPTPEEAARMREHYAEARGRVLGD